MTAVDPTRPPSSASTTEPAAPAAPTPAELITALYQAKQARDYWNAEERRLRLALADVYCAKEDGAGYANKTLDVGGGFKLAFTVTRELKVDIASEAFHVWKNAAGADKFNQLMRIVPSTVKPSMDGYNKLSDEDKAALAGAIKINESVSASFTQAKDER